MIPTVEDLRSSSLVHRFNDTFNPPGLTNFLGCVQADVDLTGISCLNFPPFSCGDRVTAGLYLEGRYFPSTGARISFTWYPDRIVREAEYRGLRLRSTTAMPFGRMAVVIHLEIENTDGRPREVQLRLGVQGGVVKAVRPWDDPEPPMEKDNDLALDPTRRALTVTAGNSSAATIEGTWPRPDVVEVTGFGFREVLAPGERWQLSYVKAVGETLDEATQTFDALVDRVPATLSRLRTEWNGELAAIFTPGNSAYSGHLPELETTDKDVLRLYWMGALGVAYFRRNSPYSVMGRTYDTLMPRYWQSVTFLWDYSLSSLVHALLDPDVLRGHIEHWMSTDIYSHFGTEWVTGSPVGQWYSVNDFAMVKMIRDYLRWTGDHAWLGKGVRSLHGGEPPVVEYLEWYARSWFMFRTPSGLASYGGIGNLLECVSTYIAEVASLNAANAFNLRFAAEVARMLGRPDKAHGYEAEARQLVTDLQKLYAPGHGFWNARLADGRLVPVRHCYDFFTVLNTIAEDLSPTQHAEMTTFFKRELRTPTWMHALSCEDADAMSGVRPDHQWTGAYTAWPAQALSALYRVGQADLAFEWMKGLAASANQGPFGQAHFAETVIEPDAGGARKSSANLPFICDWACSAGGAWASVIIESLFGVEATLADGLTATPQFADFDPKARLVGLRYQGADYEVTREGARRL
ncbi:MAG: hypothetical protein QOI20_456 [Acidimicrobiaceae bacterium]|nr:hypothetical protein [Acidimicrobiaceae bacterium]